MGYMFANATSFNQPLSNWNIANVVNMENIFYNATSFNQPFATPSAIEHVPYKKN